MGSIVSGHSSHSRSKRRRLNSEINITPLVDVMLVLLIIFMVTSPMLVSGINVDLPETSSTPASGQDEPLAVDVDSKGEVYLNETNIALEELAPRLKAVTNEKLDTRIFVRGDKNADYGAVINVIGVINEAGFTKVALVTNIKQQEVKRGK
jgi:biopolymer transport protein TolR